MLYKAFAMIFKMIVIIIGIIIVNLISEKRKESSFNQTYYIKLIGFRVDLISRIINSKFQRDNILRILNV